MSTVEKEGQEVRKEPDTVRIIIEGGRHDKWRTHHFLTAEQRIAQNVTKLVFQGSYELALIGRWTREGMERVPTEGEEIVSNLDNAILFRLERPTTVVTEDGRIFHDMSLQGQGNPNADRLDSVISTLHRDFGGINPVNLLFRAQREWLEQRAYHSTGFGRITLIDTPMTVAAPGEMEHILKAGRSL